jgi:hypothetical protein
MAGRQGWSISGDEAVSKAAEQVGGLISTS